MLILTTLSCCFNLNKNDVEIFIRSPHSCNKIFFSFYFLHTFCHVCCRTITRAFDLDWYYWIGLNDQARESDFRWVNGNGANSDDDSLFAADRPLSNAESFDCFYAFFSNTRWHAYRAWDTSCSNRYRSICEKLI